MTAPPEPSIPISEAREADYGDSLTITGVAQRMEMNPMEQPRCVFVEIRDVTGAMWIKLTDTMLWKMALGRAGATDELAPRSLMDRLVMGGQISYYGLVRRDTRESDDRHLEVRWVAEADPDAEWARLIDPGGTR